MSVTVQQFTNDGSLLLTFAPSFSPPQPTKPFPGSFRILIDPWLHGGSIIFHPRFATTQHTTAPSISSLAEIQNDIDLILITQEKADHMHKETLCTLPKDSKIRILAGPKAAKLILSWKHFTREDIIQVLDVYEEKKPKTIARIPIESYSSTSAEGEVTIANIPQVRDITGIHNAVGITYSPPGTLLAAPDGTTLRLTDMPMMSLPHQGDFQSSHSPAPPRSTNQRFLKGSLDLVEWVNPNGSAVTNNDDDDDYDATKPREGQTRAGSRIEHTTTNFHHATSSASGVRRLHNSENVLSVIYTPHGIDANSLQTYIDKHLAALKGAVPVTVLVHSLTHETNPWWMGGVVCAGAPGGVQIAQRFGVKYWLSAHDEAKESSGVATKLIKSTRYDVQQVTKILREAYGPAQGPAMGTEVIALKAGESRRLMG